MERLPRHVTSGVKQRLPSVRVGDTVNARRLLRTRQALNGELETLYDTSMRRAIVEYVLQAESERIRLNIHRLPKPHPVRLIRSPVPWSAQSRAARDLIAGNLFSATPLLIEMHRDWNSRFMDERLLNVAALSGVVLPAKPHEFEKVVQDSTLEMRQRLKQEYVHIRIYGLRIIYSTTLLFYI